MSRAKPIFSQTLKTHNTEGRFLPGIHAGVSAPNRMSLSLRPAGFCLPILLVLALAMGRVHPAAGAEKALPGDPFAESLIPDSAETSPETATSSGWAGEERPVLSSLPFVQRGWLESRNQIRLRDGRGLSTRQRLWLEGGHSFWHDQPERKPEDRKDTALRVFLSGSLDWDAAAASLTEDNEAFSATLHEAYLTFESEHADLMLGQKMARFGTGDGINPLDLINPLDHRDPFASGRSDNRLPVFLGQGLFALPKPTFVEDLSLQAIVVPLARVTKLPGRGSAWEMPGLRSLRQSSDRGLVRLAEQDRPKSWFEEGKYMLQLNATLHGWDFGLAGFAGPADTPVLTGRLNAQGERIITPEHPAMSALGLTFAKGLNRSTLRGELALKPAFPVQKKSETGALPDFARRDMMEGVIGFDRTFALNRYLNLQYFATVIPDDADLNQSGLAHGMTYEVSDQFLDDDLKLGISGIIGFSGQGWTVQPYAEYRIGDHWLLTASVMLFNGNDEGTYGQYGTSDFATLKLRWSF